jgi:hypothetical protein
MTTKKTKPTDEMIALALSMSAGMQPTSDIEEIRRRLPKEFRPYLVGDGPLGAMIRHPLYYSIVFGGSTFEIDLLVEGVAMKEKAIARAVDKGKLSSVLVYHERPYRLDAFLRYRGVALDNCKLEDRCKEKGDAIGYAWTDSENVWQNLHKWCRIWDALRYDEVTRLATMMEDDRSFMDESFPDDDSVVEVYRGASSINREGLSWTTDKEKARWFSNRFGAKDYIHPPMVYSTEVKRSEVAACFSGRGESEVVLFPHVVNLKNIKESIA